MAVTTHSKMLDELLAEVNTSEHVSVALKNLYKHTPYLKNYMECLIDNEWTTLDVNEVKFTKYAYERSMAGAFLLNRHTWAIVSEVLMKKSIPVRTKEKQFKALSEMLWSGEADILKAILTKNLEELYPNITFKSVFRSLEE